MIPYHTVKLSTEYEGYDYKNIARQHRLSKSHIPEHITNQMNRIKPLLHPSIGDLPDEEVIRFLFDSIHNLLVPRKIVQFIFNIIHESAYIAEQAIKHQRRIKMHEWNPMRVYPDTCIMHTTHTLTTVQHELFGCCIVQPIWEHTNKIITQMDGTIKVSNMTQLYTHIIHIGQQKFASVKHALQVHTNINIILITIKTIWNTYIHKMKLREQGDTELKKIRQSNS